MKTMGGESLRLLLRLLIDEIVEDLSPGTPDARAGQFKNQTSQGNSESHWVRRKDNRGEAQGKAERFRRYWACARVTTSTLPSILWLK
jgi:hypothetical protein